MADISKDAVERLAKFHDASAKLYNDPEESGLLACAVTTAATLRAQAAEIERLRKTEAAARREAMEAAALAAMKARFGPPSMWAVPGRPEGWHLGIECTPHDAAMHDNGCVDAFRAIRALAGTP